MFYEQLRSVLFFWNLDKYLDRKMTKISNNVAKFRYKTALYLHKHQKKWCLK